MTLTLLWFLAGAVSCQIIRKIVHFHEERQVFVNIVTAYIPFIKDLKTQIIIATSLKEKSLRDAKMDKSAINDIVLVGGSTRIPKIQVLFWNLDT